MAHNSVQNKRIEVSDGHLRYMGKKEYSPLTYIVWRIYTVTEQYPIAYMDIGECHDDRKDENGEKQERKKLEI